MEVSMLLQSLHERELIHQYLNGNEAAFEILLQRHKRKIYSSIFLLVRNKGLAEDIFQDTFIKVINTLRSGQYNEEGKFVGWVIRIAHNLVIDHFRREKKMPKIRETEDFNIFDLLHSNDENEYDKISRKQMHQEMRELIEKLPFEQKEVLIMRQYADVSFKEIAEITGVSINTALGRMRYALINLRKMIEEKKLILNQNNYIKGDSINSILKISRKDAGNAKN